MLHPAKVPQKSYVPSPDLLAASKRQGWIEVHVSTADQDANTLDLRAILQHLNLSVAVRAFARSLGTETTIPQ